MVQVAVIIADHEEFYLWAEWVETKMEQIRERPDQASDIAQDVLIEARYIVKKRGRSG